MSQSFMSTLKISFLAIIVMCAGCYERPTNNSGFVSMKIHENGSQCVFTYHNKVFKRASGISAYPDGGMPKYIKDQHIIGLVDFNTGRTEILLEETDNSWLPGHGEIEVMAVRKDSALVVKNGQLQDYSQRTEWFRIGLNDGAITPVELPDPYDQKLKRLIEKVQLSDNSMTILQVEQKIDGGYRDEVWAYFGDGRPAQLLVHGIFSAQIENELWLFVPELNAGLRINVDSLERINIERSIYWKVVTEFEKTRRAECHIGSQSNGASIGKKIDGEWEVKPIKLPARMLK